LFHSGCRTGLLIEMFLLVFLRVSH
jgi:hypothetical protein